MEPRHIAGFLELAAAEGWVSDRAELEFLLRTFPAGCLVQEIDGEIAGCVTAVKYERSGWIGNLIVKGSQRGGGIGSQLFRAALGALEEAGAETVWLTASAAGAPLYRKLGFQTVDTIHRWSGSGKPAPSLDWGSNPAIVKEVDREGWGDRRRAIFRMMGKYGRLVTVADGFLGCRSLAGGLQLGPFGCRSTAVAEQLLTGLLHDGADEIPLCLDSPGRNREAAALLHARGFMVGGSTLLMYRGRLPEYTPERIFALASMGSYG